MIVHEIRGTHGFGTWPPILVLQISPLYKGIICKTTTSLFSGCGARRPGAARRRSGAGQVLPHARFGGAAVMVDKIGESRPCSGGCSTYPGRRTVLPGPPRRGRNLCAHGTRGSWGFWAWCGFPGRNVSSPTHVARGSNRTADRRQVCVTAIGWESCCQSGRPDSNRRRPAWEAGILPLNYARNWSPGRGRATESYSTPARDGCKQLPGRKREISSSAWTASGELKNPRPALPRSGGQVRKPMSLPRKQCHELLHQLMVLGAPAAGVGVRHCRRRYLGLSIPILGSEERPTKPNTPIGFRPA